MNQILVLHYLQSLVKQPTSVIYYSLDIHFVEEASEL